jgi:hypothetical protein
VYGPDQRERAPACAARTHIGHSPQSEGQRARDKAVSPGQGNLSGGAWPARLRPLLRSCVFYAHGEG